MRFNAPNYHQYDELQKHAHHNIKLHTVLNVTDDGDQGMLIITCLDHNSILIEIEQPKK